MANYVIKIRDNTEATITAESMIKFLGKYIEKTNYKRIKTKERHCQLLERLGGLNSEINKADENKLKKIIAQLIDIYSDELPDDKKLKQNISNMKRQNLFKIK